MIIKCIVNGRWEENCYLVSVNKSTVIIDPAGNLEQIIQYISDNEYQVLGIINTHAHFDHIGAIADLADVYRCPFYLHSKELKLLRSANFYITLYTQDNLVRIPTVDFLFDKIQSPIIFGELSVEVLHTPGHTDGSVCFLIGDNLFTGDTLLKGKIGRADLPGGNKKKLKTSMHSILELKKELFIYPGHGDSSSLKEELISNDSLIDLLK